MPGSIHAHVAEGNRLKVEVVSDQGAKLSLVGDLTDVEPTVESGDVLADNPALLSNMWAFAKSWYEARTTSYTDALGASDPESQKAALKLAEENKKSAQKRADAYAKMAQWIADVADDVSPYEPKNGWCSSCFAKTEHRRSNRPSGQLPVFVCQGCGGPTLPCVAPGCENMAVRERGALRVPQYCAEHRHDIPGFEKAAQRSFGELHDYEDFLTYEKPNLSKVSKLAAVGVIGVAAAGPIAFVAAPAIGGAIGSLGMFGGLTGAAASSHGLALLGGGTLAAGGFGMAGGTAVVTVVGAAVGGTLGASVSNAYVREDKSFRIELLRPGKGGVPVVVANGFLTEGDQEKWGGWRTIVDARYPDSPVYRVRWGAKELKDFGVMGAALAARTSASAAVKGAATVANKAGAKLLGSTFAPAFIASDLAKNPWHVAKSRADKTGVIVADLLARTDADSYVLIGHSLGARVMAVATETLGTRSGPPRIQAAHLLGAAIGAKSNWGPLTAAVDEAVYGYHSTNDAVLKYVYKVAQAGQSAAGLGGFTPASHKLVNVDVSDRVSTHFEYQGNVQLV
ncbi:hypothetical protein CBR64_05925 [Cellulosimicrobium cellulans]|uniref:DUF726 domain-containing protein n=1 Tax=Cellulosimicrobium cellulans TaxID=1710 RepID=A0A1Y0HSF6_CELCE|nr:DUF726 domain-containing protein [Cellulosimicrobium cellulans]ARU51098.1 hypothetical protein CBR64_05925 [Cellulosimicrobium cellulans]